MMTETDTTMNEIAHGIERSQRGDRDGARVALAQIWDRVDAEGDALHRCALAHHLADCQDDVHDELSWDLRALDAAAEITDARAREAGMSGTVRGLYPSLHLNLGDDYRRLGDLEHAREHLELGQAAIGALDDTGYGQMIKGGLDRLADRLADRLGRAH